VFEGTGDHLNLELSSVSVLTDDTALTTGDAQQLKDLGFTDITLDVAEGVFKS